MSERQIDHFLAKGGIINSGGRGGFGQQTRFGHSWQRVDFQNHRLLVSPHDDIDARVIAPSHRAQAAAAESKTAKRAVGMPAFKHCCLVKTLSKAMRLASGPQPV